jgi:hypothetical protein
LDHEAGGGNEQREEKKRLITHKPFAKLADLLKTDKT